MRSTLLSFILLPLIFPLSIFASQQPPISLYTATIHHFPPSPTSPPSSPTPLALLHYHPSHPSLSHISSFTPPLNSTSTDDLTSIGVYSPNNSTDAAHLRSSVTATYSFHKPYRGRLRVWVRDGGEVVGVSWHAWRMSDSELEEGGGGKGKRGVEKKTSKGDFDIITVKPPPVVVFDKPAKGKGATAKGQGAGAGQRVDGEEEVQEKTFLQKYWWLLLGAAVLALTGPGPEK